MKKIIKLLSVVTIITCMTGCGGKKNDKLTVEFDSSKPVSITFYHTMNANLNEVLDEAIGRFNLKYPNINVENVSAGDYDGVRDQMKIAISSEQGAASDLVYCYPDHVALYNQANAVVALDSYINDTKTDENGELLYGLTKEQQDDFVTSYWNEGKEFGNNLMYSLPFSKSSEVLFYNKTFFEENELQVPIHWFKDDKGTGFTEQNSMEYVCEKIKSLDTKCYPLGYDSEANWFITMCEQYGSAYTTSIGTEHFLFDNDTNRAFVKRFKQWYDKGYFTTKDIYREYTSSLFTETNPDEMKCYMCIGSSAGASNQIPPNEAFEVGIEKIPQLDPNNGKVISQGPNVCIFNNGDNQKVMASWLLLRFLTTDVSFQANFSVISGYSPVINEVYRNEIYNELLEGANGYSNLTALSTKVANSQNDWYFTSPAFVGSSDARDEVGILMDKVFTDERTDLDTIIDEAFKASLESLKAKGAGK